MTGKFPQLIVLLAAAVSVSGCAIPLTVRDPVSLDILRKEGFVTLPRTIAQPHGERYDCGPEVAVAVLTYWEVDASLEEAARSLESEKNKGTKSSMLAPYIRRKGLAADPVKGSIGMIKNAVDAGRPPIIMLEVSSQPRVFGNPFQGEKVFHFFCVAGYCDAARKVLCVAPERRWYEIDYAVLLDYWKKAGYFLVNTRPMEAEDHFLLGRESAALGDHSAAAAHFRKALELSDRHLLSLIGLGNSLQSLGEPREALEIFLKAKAIAPDDPQVLNNTADLLAALDERIDEALTLSERAVTLYQNERTLLKQRLASTIPEEERAESRRVLKSGEFKLALALGTLGGIRSKKGDHLAAIAAWGASMDLIPLDMADLRARRLLDMGSAHRELRDFRKARECMSHAANIVKDPALKSGIEEALRTIP